MRAPGRPASTYMAATTSPAAMWKIVVTATTGRTQRCTWVSVIAPGTGAGGGSSKSMRCLAFRRAGPGAVEGGELTASASHPAMPLRAAGLVTAADRLQWSTRRTPVR